MSAAPDLLFPAIPGYRLRGQVGRGGFGTVYLGEADNGGQVAIKVLHRVLDDDARRRFDDEVQIMGTLGWHPNIVRILDAGTVEEGQSFIVMEHLPDGSLGGELRAEGPVPWAIVLRHAADAATALQVAHNAGLLHRDIKPDNLLRTADGRVKLSDFGVTTTAAAASGGGRGATGTLAYSAPELLAGGAPSVASDIYALGATMFALLSGDPAFHRTTDESPAALIIRAYRDPLPDLRPTGAPESLIRVVERAMAKEPTDRPGSAADFEKELRAAAAAESVQMPAAAPTGQPQPAVAVSVGPPAGGLPVRPSAGSRKRAQRWQKVTSAVGAVAALVIAVSVVTVSDFGQPSGEDAADAPSAVDAPADPPAGAEEDDQVEGDAADPGDAAPPLPPVGATPPPGPTVPAPLPGLPATGPVDALSVLELDARAVGGTGDAGRSVVVTANSLEVFDLDGSRSASIAVDQVTELAISGDVIAAVREEVVGLFDADTLVPLGTVTVPSIVEITAAGGAFWAATDGGVIRISSEGAATPVRGTATALTQIAASGDVVWASTGDGELMALDAGTGRLVGEAALDAKVSELAVLQDGSVLAVVEGQLRGITLDGVEVGVAVPERVIDVAVTDNGVVFVLTAEGLLRLDDGAGTPVVSGEVRAIWPSGPVISAAVDSPPSVERYG